LNSVRDLLRFCNRQFRNSPAFLPRRARRVSLCAFIIDLHHENSASESKKSGRILKERGPIHLMFISCCKSSKFSGHDSQVF
jgi:hypothetical protein